MRERNIIIITGKIERDIHGTWEDCSPGLYIDTRHIESILGPHVGKSIRIVIGETDENEVARTIDDIERIIQGKNTEGEETP